MIAYFGCFHANGMLSIIMEFADGGSLSEAISLQAAVQQPFLTEVVVRWMLHDGMVLERLGRRRWRRPFTAT